MITKLKTAATAYPVNFVTASDCELKRFLNIASADTTFDSLLLDLVKGATNLVETEIERKLITQTWDAYMREWPVGEDYLELPFGQLQSISYIKYRDTDGDWQTWSSGGYVVEVAPMLGQVWLGYNQSWPTSVLYPGNPINIQYICGYGSTYASVPDGLRKIIMSIISNAFNNREDPSLSEADKKSLLNFYLIPYKI